MQISRLGSADAEAVVDCFRRVYGDSYANELFYDPVRLGEAMAAGRVGCVGAKDDEGRVMAHMALTVRADASVVEQGNTVVDPVARGHGLAWKVGAELSAWSQELDFQGFVHYPTTDHHIMQRQSVKGGFETGLMLGYIPAETNGRVRTEASRLREAATIVYQPYRVGAEASAYLPEYCSDHVREFSDVTGLVRDWRSPDGSQPAVTELVTTQHHKRGLRRSSVSQVGADLVERIAELDAGKMPCRQIDFLMSDPGIDSGVETACEAGYWFCGWLPGFGTADDSRPADVFRLQRVDRSTTQMHPELVNTVAHSLLALVPDP